MPTIGPFHRKYWRARANAVLPPGTTVSWMYPKVQTTVTIAFHMIAFGLPFGALRPLWRQLRWLLGLLAALWWLRHPDDQATLEDVLGKIQRGESLTPDPIVIHDVHRVEVPVHVPVVPIPKARIKPSAVRQVWQIGRKILALDAMKRAVVDRVLDVIEGPHWEPAKAAVADVATSPKFHSVDQWVEYSRAIKANAGQAQNVYRHLKAVQTLRGLHDGEAAISNPDAHLAVELAYQGHAAQQTTRKPAQIIDHPVLHRKDI